MSGFSADDYRYMARALKLARRGLYTTAPNPMVGCVLVRDGTVVGEGWHERAGEAHAEVNALAAAGDAARGSTAYVTLEPCAHTGRTGPCSRALIDAGVARVVSALEDPFPEVGGRGHAALVAAGIDVGVGLLTAEARELNRGFLSRIERGRPFVTLKLAASLDGATAMASGESQWITGKAARRDVQRLRARADAILTGSGTVLADDPRLTLREPGLRPAPPLRVVVDSGLGVPATAALLREPGDVLLLCCEDAGRAALEEQGAIVETLPGGNEGGVSLPAALRRLAERNVNELLVEAGPRLSGAMLDGGLVDELVIYQSPHIMGSNTRGLAATPAWTTLAARLELEVVERRVVGRDLRLVARPLPRD